MNQVLAIPDVLRSICDDLDGKSALAIALTCRGSLEPGLDSLWYSIESLEPFICCLPPGAFTLLTEDEHGRQFTYLMPSKDFTQGHLRRYLTFYARRIRRFVTPSNESQMLSNEFLMMLQLMTHNEPGVLAPLNRTVCWNHPAIIDKNSKADLSAFMSLFIGPHLLSLDVAECSNSPLHKASVHTNLKRIHNQLKQLYLSGLYDVGLAESFFTTYSWESLQCTTFNALSPGILRHASLLPQLEKLIIRDSMSPESTLHQLPAPLSPPSGGFPLLRLISVKAKVVRGGVSNILKYLPPENRVQRVQFAPKYKSPSSACQGIIDAIAQHCNPTTLKSIVLIDQGRWRAADGPHPEDNHFDEAYAEKPLNIQALGAFSMLEELSVRWSVDIYLPAKEAYRLPTCWPQIRHLDLCTSRWLNGRVPAPDHLTILHVLKSCPRIEYLGMRFDTTQITEADGARGEPTFPKLRSLRVGDSPISSPYHVITFMEARFTSMGVLDVSYDSPCEEPTLLDERWAFVVKGLGLES